MKYYCAYFTKETIQIQIQRKKRTRYEMAKWQIRPSPDSTASTCTLTPFRVALSCIYTLLTALQGVTHRHSRLHLLSQTWSMCALWPALSKPRLKVLFAFLPQALPLQCSVTAD